MEFGHVYDNLDAIDFSLPVDNERTLKTLTGSDKVSELQVFIGGTKWSNKSWLCKTYPRGLKDADMLREYSKNFNAIEFGPTFYTTQSDDKISAWVNEVKGNEHFKFCPKFPQSASHVRRLRNAEEVTNQFYQSLKGFDEHLGVLILQLGENFSPKLFSDLEHYLEALPTEPKVFMEVRHKDWFGNEEHRTKLYNLLQRLNIGWVISDTAGRRDCVHLELTTNDALVRFVGDGLHPTTFARLDAWVERFAVWKGHGLQSIWFFMHNHEERQVPVLCDYLITALNKRLGVNLKSPQLKPQQSQDELF
jgi:uncharacterized protein YecE (DUF72 family)